MARWASSVAAQVSVGADQPGHVSRRGNDRRAARPADRVHARRIDTRPRFGLAPHPGIWAAVAAARAVAEALDGEAVDTMARCLVPPGDLAEDIPESGQVVIPRHLAFDLQALPAGGSALVSGGLAKFGLPDVELPGVPADLIREASEILGLVAAVLADWRTRSGRRRWASRFGASWLPSGC